MKYSQEIEKAVGMMEALIGSCFKDTADPPATVRNFYDALTTLKRAAEDSARWSERMMLLERRIRASQDIFDGAGSVSIEEERGEPASLAVLLRPAQAKALVLETSGKTGSLSERAKRARDDIARALLEPWRQENDEKGQ